MKDDDKEKPTIHKLKEILEKESFSPVRINPDGSLTRYEAISSARIKALEAVAEAARELLKTVDYESSRKPWEISVCKSRLAVALAGLEKV